MNGDGRQELVGLQFERRGTSVSDPNGVRLDGAMAVNGPTDGGTFVSPGDDNRITLLRKATCAGTELSQEG